MAHRPKTKDVKPGPGFSIRKSIDRPSEDLIAKFRNYRVPDISDVLNRMYTMRPDIKKISGPDKILVGPACTVRGHAGDNLMIHKSLDIAQPGDIVVIDTNGSYKNAALGELIVWKARSRGISGFIVDGMIRDLPGITKYNFPVYARGLSPVGPLHNGPGEINNNISCGGIVVQPGDIIVADTNGIVVVRKNTAEDTFSRVQSHCERMGPYWADVEKGIFSNDWIDKILEERNCSFED